jgi:hypothetical protein
MTVARTGHSAVEALGASASGSDDVVGAGAGCAGTRTPEERNRQDLGDDDDAYTGAAATTAIAVGTWRGRPRHG